MKKFNTLFREYMGYILSVLVVLGYILTAVFTLDETGRTVQEILVNSFIIFTLGVLLSNTMGLQGMHDGEQEGEVIDVKKQHADILLETQPHWHEIPKYCTYKNKQAIRQERERILNFATLRYQDFYNEDGQFIGNFIPDPTDKYLQPMVKKQNQAIQNTIDLDITQITPTDLITESAKPNDPLARGRSKREYITQTNIKDLFGKVATAIFGGIYTASFLGADIGEIAYRVVIAIILLAFGILRYYMNFNYMINENKERVVMATHWLQEFHTLHQRGHFQEATE